MRPRLWLALFVLLQIADGVLTYAAVERFGPSAEGNPIVATWILLTGSGPAVVGAKVLACACGTFLYVAGVHSALIALSALYLVAAVVPWVHVFSTLPI
jgi:hypothetical protein